MRLFLISLAVTTTRAAAAPAATVDPAVEFTHCMEDRTAAMGSDASLTIDTWKACAPGAAAPQPSSLQPTTMLSATPTLMDPGEGASQWIVDRLMTKWKKAACGDKCGADGVAGLYQYIRADIEKSNKRGATIGLMQLESVRNGLSNIVVGAVEKSLKGSSSAFFGVDDFAEEATKFSHDHNTQATWYTYAKRLPEISLVQADIVQRIAALPGAAANPKLTTALAAFAALGNTSTTLPYAPAAATAPSLLQMAAGAFGI
jgi:hypothetical protein